jgi:hypothetical protein
MSTSNHRDAIAEISMSYNSLVRLGRCEAMVLYPPAAALCQELQLPARGLHEQSLGVIVIVLDFYVTNRAAL